VPRPLLYAELDIPVPEGVPSLAELEEEASEAAVRARMGSASAPVRVLPAPPRRPGRPGWTRETFWPRFQDACSRTTPPFSNARIAPHFVTLDGTRGTNADYVRKLVRRFGRPPEDARLRPDRTPG
jgi:hypothetical protein